MERARVLEQIHAAFPPTTIAAAGAFSPWGWTYPDAEPYMGQLEGKSWDRLDRTYMVRRSDALGFLNTRHLAELLPLYLCSLTADGVWSPAASMLMLILTKPGPGKRTGVPAARFDALVDALTDAQRVAVASALRAFAGTDEDGSLGRAALAALASHWARYLPASGAIS
jgi:hypothetical protein